MLYVNLENIFTYPSVLIQQIPMLHRDEGLLKMLGPSSLSLVTSNIGEAELYE